jgi:osmotically-inducible protein OsmY
VTLHSITRLICLITFLALAVVQTSYAQNEENSEPTAADVTPDTIDVETAVEDAKISKRLKDILEASGWFAEITIQVRNGIVTINGLAYRQITTAKDFQ